jgi:toxin ParE1/3/4
LTGWLLGDVGIVTILHERMHQIDRLREDFGL